MPQKFDPELLQAALIGLQHKLVDIENQISELRDRLTGQPVKTAGPAPGARKRTMSAAGRRRIALAQKKRWAAYKSKQGKPASKVAARPAKKAMSAEGRARIAAAAKKRWAAFRKAQKTPKAPASVAASAAPEAQA